MGVITLNFIKLFDFQIIQREMMGNAKVLHINLIFI